MIDQSPLESVKSDITVEFDNKTIQMPYPSSFENILTAMDPTFEEHVKELNKISVLFWGGLNIHFVGNLLEG